MIYPRSFQVFLFPTIVLLSLMGGTSLTVAEPTEPSHHQSLHKNERVDQLISKGLKRYRDGDYRQAQVLFQTAAKPASNQSNELSQGLSFVYLSLTHQQLQEWDDAKDSLSKGLRLFRTSSPLPPRYLALALNTKGRLSFSLGQTEQALEDWEQAEHYYDQSNDAEGIIGSQVNQAQALTVLGFHHRACKSLLNAIAINRDCNLSDVTALKNAVKAFQTQSNPQVRSLGLLTLGNLLRLAGNFDAAKELLSPLEEQFPISFEQKHSSAGLRSSLMLSLSKLQRAYSHKQLRIYQRTSSIREKDTSLKLAIKHARKSLEYFHKAELASSSSDGWGVLQIQLFRLGLLQELQLELGQESDEFPIIQKAIATIPHLTEQIIHSNLDQRPPSQSVVQGQLRFAKILLKSKTHRNSQQALRYTKIALIGAKQIQDVSSQSQALGVLGKLYEQAEQWQDAQNLTKQALSLANERQDHQQMAEWQWQLGRLYQRQGEVQSSVGDHHTQSLQAYHQAVQNLGIVRQNLRVMQNEVEFSFRENVEPVYRQYVSLLLRTNVDANEYQGNVKQALQVFDDFQVAELEDFLNCNLTLRAKQLPDLTSAFIYPIVLDDRIEVIIQLPNNQPLVQYATPIPIGKLDRTLTDLRRELEQLYRSSQGLKSSQQVYDWILRPAESTFQKHNVKNLIFVLDGPLRNIPIGALHDGNQYLVEKGYGIALLPGLELFESRPNRKPLKALTFGLARGNPPLPNVPQELLNINQVLNVKQYLDESFSNQVLESQLLKSPFSILHLATHGQFSSNPEQTYLQTWKGRITGDELSQLLQSRANAPGSSPLELLVLSACKTAAGDPRAILGLAGIAVQSGAKSTLSSLWAVNDRSTSILMNEFYQELTSSKSITKAEALRRAQVKLLNTPGYESPRFWGAFVLVGHWK